VRPGPVSDTVLLLVRFHKARDYKGDHGVDRTSLVSALKLLRRCQP
jgi:hypothetical protein